MEAHVRFCRQPRRASSMLTTAGALRPGACTAALKVPSPAAMSAVKLAHSLSGGRTPLRRNPQLTGGTINQGAHRGNQDCGAEPGMAASSGG
ncbi:hypothetical protein NDU88_008101 [Pleurodeles waltl]|uniref:Uncharacterized protein n=1 Tax=Pleurodeles waltl TaxID=8319 RepID=A0AAV7PNT3_PLEWA|nr:hypothetical protein NDU88_008101 [Pleurodeles waltl]